MSEFRHIFTADVKGYWLTGLDLVSSTTYTAGDRVTGDWTRFIFYIANGDKRDEIGRWDSRTDSVLIHEALPMITEEISLSEGQAVIAKRERHGYEAPPLREFDVQPTIQFKGA